MRYVYLTSTEVRHTAFLDALTPDFLPTLIIREPKINKPPIKSNIIQEYQTDFAEQQRYYFTASQASRYSAVRIEPGAINHPSCVATIRQSQPDILLVFGTSLLAPEILSIPRLFSLNIHTGITQLFRGVDSAFWAIHDDKPEGIGATIHLINPTIDAGDVVLQARVTIDADDTLPQLFFKSVMVGFELMGQALSGLQSGQYEAQPLTKRGRLYQSADFNELSLLKAEQQRQHVLNMYLANKPARDLAIPILSRQRV
ncbi:MAG: formyl transferase [Chloroflexota bacterium]